MGENPPCSAKSFPENGGSQWGHLGVSLVKHRAGLRDDLWDEEHCPGLLSCVTQLCWCDKLIHFSPLRYISALGMLIIRKKLICSLISPQRTSFPIPQPMLWDQGSACPCPSVSVTRMSLPVAAPTGNTQPKVLEQPPTPGSVQTPQELVWGLGDNFLGQGQSHISHLSWPD